MLSLLLSATYLPGGTCSVDNSHRGVMDTTTNSDKHVWMPWGNLITYFCRLHMDIKIFESAEKKSQIKKYPDMCGWG